MPVSPALLFQNEVSDVKVRDPVDLSNTANPPFTNSTNWVLPAATIVSGGTKFRPTEATSYWLMPSKLITTAPDDIGADGRTIGPAGRSSGAMTALGCLNS